MLLFSERRDFTMADNRYIDTRGNVTEPVSFRQAVVDGLADGGGLYVAETIPTFTVTTGGAGSRDFCSSIRREMTYTAAMPP